MKKDVKKKKDTKPQYRAPVILDLGELARGAGATCSPGGLPAGSGIGFCQNGGIARGQCIQGSGV
jgi:hypothetical protein